MRRSLALALVCAVPVLHATLAAQAASGTTDSTYTTDALRTLVAAAAAQNTLVPPALISYRARAETEFALLFRWPNGTEAVAQIEQVESQVRWLRTGAFTQHVVGYRARLEAPNVSLISMIHRAWAVPVLYGNRLELFAGHDSTAHRRRLLRRETGVDTNVAVVHPFAVDRDAVYRFSGGDTVLTLRAGNHVVPVSKVHVTPRSAEAIGRPAAVFEGDVYLDATRHQIVRMRGTFRVVGRHRSLLNRVERGSVQAAFFVDLTSTEIEGQFWLPYEQRIEAQISSPLSGAGTTRSVLRVVTHFTDYQLNDTTPSPVALASGESDTLELLPHTLSYAPTDSMTAWKRWEAPIGTATAARSANDFNDVAPDPWRPTGSPRIDLGVDRTSDALRFDRVEGLYTGFGAVLNFRDAAPGLTARANAGWAWWEKTARGAATLQWQRDDWILDLRAARTLDNTNDFAPTWFSGPNIEALVGQDDYDYVDRRSATVSLERVWSGLRNANSASGMETAAPAVPVVTHIDLGIGEDLGDRARLRRGIFPPNWFMNDSLFRPNRNVLQGDYVHGAFTLDVNPGVDVGLLQPGVGARLKLDAGTGQLAWERAEARLTATADLGPFVLGGRLDGGIVGGSRIPPQQIFEIGYTEGLLGYDYKAFGGDEAAILREQILYPLPIWRAPLRIGRFILPGLSPSIALGGEHGWANASTPAARTALIALGSRVNPATDVPLIDPATSTPYPASIPTDGVVSSTDLMLRFFGQSVGIGVARGLNAYYVGPRWQFVFRLGAAL